MGNKGISYFLRRLQLWLRPQCPKCGVGRTRYVGDDKIGFTWVSVYECDTCYSKFI